MITNSREKGSLQAKIEGENNKIELSNFFKASSSTPSSSSRQWGGFRNPRIVRVSRSFGGKDRHSKVCTVRGLRDRRIRLSVPTAIQLYDLQDRLGLSQPSKVIDWLLDATKDDIDKLPPLQIPQGFGHQFHHQHLLLPHGSNPPPPHHLTQPSLASFYDAQHDQTLSSSIAKTKYWDVDGAGSSTTHGNTNIPDGIGIGIGSGFGGQLVFGQKFFPMSSTSATTTHSCNLPGTTMLNNSMAYNYYHSEPSNLSLSQFGSHGFASQIDSHAGNVSSFSSSPAPPLPLASGPSQLFFCPPTTPQPPLFSPYPTPYITTTSSPVESHDIPRQINHVQLLPNSLMPSLQHSSSLPFKSFQTISNNPKQLRSHHNDESQPAAEK